MSDLVWGEELMSWRVGGTGFLLIIIFFFPSGYHESWKSLTQPKRAEWQIKVTTCLLFLPTTGGRPGQPYKHNVCCLCRSMKSFTPGGTFFRKTFNGHEICLAAVRVVRATEKSTKTYSQLPRSSQSGVRTARWRIYGVDLDRAAILVI